MMRAPTTLTRCHRAAAPLAACATLACGGIIGCVGPKAPPTVVRTSGQTQPPQQGQAAEALPPVTLSQAASTVAGQTLHAVTILAPTGGWSAELDQERAAWQRREVYITLRRPSPLFMTTQVQTPLTVATTVPTSEAVEVFIRIADATERVPESAAYTQAVLK